MTLKICFIMTNIFTVGGVQRVVSVLANELSEKHEVEIICTSQKEKKSTNFYDLNENIKVIYNLELIKINLIKKIIYKLLKILNSNSNIFNNRNKVLEEIYYPTTIRNKFVKYINNINYDIVIGVEGKYSLLLGMIKNRINIKAIGWFHNSYEAYFETKNRYYWRMNTLFKKYIRCLDRCIVLTEHDKSLLKKNMGLDCVRIYNPVSFLSENKSVGNNQNIICVARLVEQQKGLDMLIDAFEIVSKKHNDWKLMIVGDGPDKDKLIKKINIKNLNDKIKIIHHQKDIKKYYLNSDLFVSSSRWEGFGLVITEAMECGLPVVAFNNSGPSEIITNNINGFLVPKNDIISLAEIIHYLINNEKERKEISQKAILRAKDFSQENITEQWENILQQILGENKYGV